MTRTEMNRRIATMSPKAIARVEHLARHSTYTPREVFAFRIPGTGTLANVNAVFQKVKEEEAEAPLSELADALVAAAHYAGAVSRRSEDENEAHRNAMIDAGRGHLLR